MGKFSYAKVFDEENAYLCGYSVLIEESIQYAYYIWKVGKARRELVFNHLFQIYRQ